MSGRGFKSLNNIYVATCNQIWPEIPTQGYCSLIESVTMNETRIEDKFSPILCFPSETKFLLFVLFPGQKVFISLIHPFQALPSVELRKFSEFFKKKIFSYFSFQWAGISQCCGEDEGDNTTGGCWQLHRQSGWFRVSPGCSQGFWEMVNSAQRS